MVPAEIYRPLALSRHPSVTLAALRNPPLGMGSAPEALTAPSLNVRRPGAPSLTSFDFPPPNFQIGSPTPRYTPSSSHSTLDPPRNIGVPSILTPPDAIHSDDGSVSMQPVTTSTGIPVGPGLPPPYPSIYWQSQDPYSRTPRDAQPHSWDSNASTVFPSRTAFSSPLGQLGRESTISSAATNGMSQHPHEVNQFLPVSSPSLPSHTSQQQPHRQQQQQQQMLAAMKSSDATQSDSTASSQALNSNGPYGVKSQSTPSYGLPRRAPNTHHRDGYASPYGEPSSLTYSNQKNKAPKRMPAGESRPAPSPPSQLNYKPWPSYSLPAMPGPVMTNVHSPNSSMSLVGNLQPNFLSGFHSGHAASMQQMYGSQPPLSHPQPGPANDRPFKCDQCPQSFNRNHDLKRHKRIHLSIKPFPCTHCDKSFSRKDALKVVHLLHLCYLHTWLIAFYI